MTRYAGMVTSLRFTQAPWFLWGGAALLVIALGLLYRTVLPAWLEDLWIDPNYSHGLLVPFAAAWLVYERRSRLAALAPRPAGSAVLIVLGGIVLLVAGTLAAELFTTRLSELIVITGLIGFILGYSYIRTLALPLAFLLFMVPLPDLILNAIAFPLQLLASQTAVSILQGIGVPALREGNVILLPNITLEVAEACSGLRSLVSLGAMSVLLAALTLRGTVPRLVLIASSLPIAVITNSVRVSGTGVLAYHFGAQLAEGFLHSFSGWVVFVIALVLLGAEGSALRLLDKG
jgi:exosortase